MIPPGCSLEPRGESLLQATLLIDGKHAQAFASVGEKLHPHEPSVLRGEPCLREAVPRTLVPKDPLSAQRDTAPSCPKMPAPLTSSQRALIPLSTCRLWSCPSAQTNGGWSRMACWSISR